MLLFDCFVKLLLTLSGSLVFRSGIRHGHKSVDIEHEAENHYPEHDGQKQFGPFRSRELKPRGGFIYAEEAGDFSSSADFLLIALLVLRVVFVGHLFAEDKFLPTHSLEVVLGFLFDILVEQGAPVDDEQSVGIVVGSGYTLQLTGSDKFTGQN